MPERKFTYESYESGTREITLRRAAPEWCNADCPSIWASDPDTPWRCNADGCPGMEHLPDDVAVLYTRFVKASSEAFYRKYPDIRNQAQRNGFWENFKTQTAKARGDHYVQYILALAFPSKAPSAAAMRRNRSNRVRQEHARRTAVRNTQRHGSSMY